MRLINAEKLFEEVGRIKPRNKEHYKAIAEFMNMITNSETINTRPKGEWVRTKNPIGETIVVCSNCRKIRQQGYDDFCGFCGADMRGDKE